jgi:3-hydroxyacyl-CoA dehydrogenase/enoyl-CoA hydratase/3-hydroxybutyryl-CoA epimerase
MKGFGYSEGPLALLDQVGLDVAAHVTAFLSKVMDDRWPKTGESLSRLVQEGFLGKKNNQGLYLYSKKGRKRANPQAVSLIRQESGKSSEAERIQERLSLAMVNEAVRCLEEGIIASPRDGDVGAVMGLGFPPFRGGPFHHVDALGADRVVIRLETLGEQVGPHLLPAAMLKDMARSGTRFFP